MSDKWEIVALPQGDEIMKNGKVASVDEASRILNYHERLREALDNLLVDYTPKDGSDYRAARDATALLDELDSLENG